MLAMEPVPLFFTVVLACTFTSLLMAAAAYLVHRIRTRRTTEAPLREVKSAPPAPTPATPRERTPVMSAPPVPAQMFTPPKEMPKTEAAPASETKDETKTERPERGTESKTSEPETMTGTVEVTEGEAATETREIETMETETMETETMETEAGEAKKRAQALPEPFFREYMGPGRLVPVRISRRSEEENDDAFIWL